MGRAIWKNKSLCPFSYKFVLGFPPKQTESQGLGCKCFIWQRISGSRSKGGGRTGQQRRKKQCYSVITEVTVLSNWESLPHLQGISHSCLFKCRRLYLPTLIHQLPASVLLTPQEPEHYPTSSLPCKPMQTPATSEQTQGRMQEDMSYCAGRHAYHVSWSKSKIFQATADDSEGEEGR